MVIMESFNQATQRLRTTGARAAVLFLAVAALASGCYYRGRPPEYGHRDHRDDRHYDHRYYQERHY
jgi:hypothetical protein